MKNRFIMLCFLLGCYSVFASEIDDCSQAHSPATYALSHAKKSLKADNFDHQKYYAERSLEAFEKTKAMIQNCGCNTALAAIEEGTINLQKAISPEDWDKGRFYTKKAYAEAQNLIGALEVCTSGKRQTFFNDSDSYSSDVDEDTADAQQQLIIEKQEALKRQQQQLIEEQRKLEEELATQQRLKEQRALARQKELESQIKLKVKAEQALQNFEKSIEGLSEVLDCKETYDIVNENYIRAEKALESETLSDTKRYYIEKTRDIAHKVMRRLENCALKH